MGGPPQPSCTLPHPAQLNPAQDSPPATCCRFPCRLLLLMPVAGGSTGRSLVVRVQLIELRPGTQVVKLSKDVGASMEVRRTVWGLAWG